MQISIAESAKAGNPVQGWVPMTGSVRPSAFFASDLDAGDAVCAAFRFGDRGAHTSRTMMLAEATALFDAVRVAAAKDAYRSALLEENATGKQTASNRASTLRRLTEFYSLDPNDKFFRVFRRCWDVDKIGRPLIAALAALARDPRFRSTASVILSLPKGAELHRDAVRTAIGEVSSGRLNPAIVDKLLRNAASSWSQSGHLEGRTFKRRKAVRPTEGAAAMAAWLAYQAGFRGAALFASDWFRVLDATPTAARDALMEAKRHGLLDLRMADEVVSIDFGRLERPLGAL